jgi:hypothetical protein
MKSQVEHTDNKYFVINTASFYSPFEHHQISGTPLPHIQAQDLAECAAEGSRNWDNNNFDIPQPAVSTHEAV